MLKWEWSRKSIKVNELERYISIPKKLLQAIACWLAVCAAIWCISLNYIILLPHQIYLLCLADVSMAADCDLVSILSSPVLEFLRLFARRLFVHKLNLQCYCFDNEQTAKPHCSHWRKSSMRMCKRIIFAVTKSNHGISPLPKRLWFAFIISCSASRLQTLSSPEEWHVWRSWPKMLTGHFIPFWNKVITKI